MDFLSLLTSSEHRLCLRQLFLLGASTDVSQSEKSTRKEHSDDEVSLRRRHFFDDFSDFDFLRDVFSVFLRRRDFGDFFSGGTYSDHAGGLASP